MTCSAAEFDGISLFDSDACDAAPFVLLLLLLGTLLFLLLLLLLVGVVVVLVRRRWCKADVAKRSFVPVVPSFDSLFAPFGPKCVVEARRGVLELQAFKRGSQLAGN
jgi:hypothetical protein